MRGYYERNKNIPLSDNTEWWLQLKIIFTVNMWIFVQSLVANVIWLDTGHLPGGPTITVWEEKRQ